MNFLSISNVVKDFGQYRALRGINLSINQGEFVCFLGPSGCGKTTLLNIISGLSKLNSGSICCLGDDITALPAAKRKFGIVFQNYALFPNLNVEKNITYGLRGKQWGALARKDRANELLELIGLPDIACRYPNELSGGQQQRVALARAIANRPNLLLLDEPLSALDAKVRLTLRNEIKQLQRKLGITVIMVTHDQEEAIAVSDRIVLMNNGKVEQIGTPEELYLTPNSQFVGEFIGHMNMLSLPNCNGGGVFGIRYEHVVVNIATEVNVHNKNTHSVRLQSSQLMGAFYRVSLIMSDQLTQVYADIPYDEYKSKLLSKESILAMTLPESLWCKF